MAIYTATPSTYDILQELLATLWKNDDILFEEDCREAKRFAEMLKDVVSDGKKMADILNRADDDVLDQDSLFELQDLVAEAAVRHAGIERRTWELKKNFPWLFRD